MTTSTELFRLDDRHALIAGGAGLLGESFAEGLLEAGSRVTVLDLNAKRLRDLEEAFGARFIDRYRSSVADLTDEKAVEDAVSEAEEWYPIDILINAAAIDPKTADMASSTRRDLPFAEYPIDMWKKSMDVNLTGIFLVTRSTCRRFEARECGVVVNISSTYGLVGPDQRLYRDGQVAPFFIKPGDYSVTKAGMIGFTSYLAAYYAGRGIRVNCLTPGGVDNNHDPLFKRAYASRTLLGRMANRDEYKGAILFLCSDASSYMTGANLVVDGGWTAI